MKGLNFVNLSPILLLIAVSLVSEVQSFGCYSCWSNNTATPECATGPIIRLDIVECPDTDTCLTAIVGESTFRGCSSSIVLPEDYPLKETCDIEFCNYRVFPADRLICYKCQGERCIQPAGNSRACVNYSPYDQCYTEVISETNTIRGCVSDGNATATEYTFTCNSSLCNNQRSYEGLECLTCSSNETLDCIRPLDAGETCRISVETTCSINILLGRQGYCYTYQSGDYIQRGCSMDSTYVEKEPMKNVEYETKCYDSNCNSECIPQGVCYVCDSATNPNCGTNLTGLTPETCSSQAISSCFTCLGTDGVVRRGCGTGDETGNCIFCNNLDGCNNRTLTRCYSCSSANGRDCVDPEGSESVSTILCDSNCIETIVDHHVMVRGCENPAFTCDGTDSSYCNTCEGELCNNAVKPLGALDCYQCGKDNPCNEIPETDIKPTTCKYYEPSDRCVQFYTKPYIIRGCLSDDIGEQCVDEGNECLNCDTSGCNNLPLYKAPSLSCIQCSSTEECAWGFQTSAGTPCKSDVFFWEQEACYLDRYNATEVSRGCVLDSACTNCKTCTTNNCNNENVLQQYCVQCSIKDNPLCTSVSTQDATSCKASIQTYQDRGCYILNKGSNIIRGCISGLSSEDRELCTESANNNRCQVCLDQSCNIQDLTDGSAALTTSIALLLISASTIAAYF